MGRPPKLDDLPKWPFGPDFNAAHWDAIWAPRYDFQRLSVARSSVNEPRLEFFSDPLGVESPTSLAPRRDLQETNMYYPRQLPQGNQFLVVAIRVLVVPGWGGAPAWDPQDELDYQKLMLSGLVEFTVANRHYCQQGPLARFPACFHVPQLFKLQPAELPIVSIRREIELNETAYHKLTPTLIPSAVGFGVSITYNRPLTLLRDAMVGVILDGFLYRQAI